MRHSRGLVVLVPVLLAVAVASTACTGSSAKKTAPGPSGAVTTAGTSTSSVTPSGPVSSGPKSSGSTTGPTTGASGSGGPSAPSDPQATATASAPTRGGPHLRPVPPTFPYAGLTWTNRATDIINNCAKHAVGAAVAYLNAHPCRQATRTITTTTVAGRVVDITQYVIVLAQDTPSATPFKTADQYLALVRHGRGDLKNLFQEGVRYPAGPAVMSSDSAFGAVRQDVAVVVVRAAYTHGPTDPADPALHKIVKAAYTLQTAAN